MIRLNRTRARRQRGMTLLEVLVAFFILFVVTVAILEMFSMATAVNMGSQARTELGYRAQRAIEGTRLLYALANLVPPVTPDCGIAVTLPAPTGGPVDFPPGGKTACWGPTGYNVLDPENRFVLSYEITDGGLVWILTVTARPNENNPVPLYDRVAAKAVRYVAQIPRD
jgi:type II secretory pathway pseudopilin PulG